MTADDPRGIDDTDHRWPLVSPGVWLEARSGPRISASPGLFLDRDGVVISDKGYLASPKGVQLLPGAGLLIAEANRCSVSVTVVTNQSGLARQLFGWAEFARVEREIARHLALAAAGLDAVAACPFHPDFTANYSSVESHWRKSEPGMLLAVASLLNIEVSTSWLVGDQARDIEAARAAGLAGAVYFVGDPQ